jgi:hypothetical protein
MRTIKYRNVEYTVNDAWEKNGVVSIKAYKIFDWGFGVLEVFYADEYINYNENKMTASDIDYFNNKRGEQQ